MTRTADHDSDEFFRGRGFGLRIGFGDRPALIVIDFQLGFTDPDMPLGADLVAELEAAHQVLVAARAAGCPVIYTVARFEQADLADAGVWRRKQGGIGSLMVGTAAVEIEPRVGPASGEHVIPKKYASAFFGTDLSSRLTSAEVDTLLIVGCTTSGCVRATAVDAVQLGFRPMVVREAVGDRSPRAHAQSLLDLDRKYADVVTIVESIAYLGGVRPRGST